MFSRAVSPPRPQLSPMPNTKIDWLRLHPEPWDACFEDDLVMVEWLALKLQNLMWRLGDEDCSIPYDLAWLHKKLRWQYRVYKLSGNHKTLEHYLAKLFTSGWLKISSNNTLYNEQTRQEFKDACDKSAMCRAAAEARKSLKLPKNSPITPPDLPLTSPTTPQQYNINHLDSTNSDNGRTADAMPITLPTTIGSKYEDW